MKGGKEGAFVQFLSLCNSWQQSNHKVHTLKIPKSSNQSQRTAKGVGPYIIEGGQTFDFQSSCDIKYIQPHGSCVLSNALFMHRSLDCKLYLISSLSMGKMSVIIIKDWYQNFLIGEKSLPSFKSSQLKGNGEIHFRQKYCNLQPSQICVYFFLSRNLSYKNSPDELEGKFHMGEKE